MNLLSSVLIYLLSTLITSKPLLADNLPKNELMVNKIQVVTEYLPPYQIENEDGTLGGFSTDVIHALFKQANREANIEVLPWARAYQIAKMDKNTMIFSIAHTLERDHQFHWIGSLFKERIFFWGLKSKFPSPIAATALLKGYRVAAARNSNSAQYLAADNFFNIYHSINEDQNIQMLFSNRIDLLIETELTLKDRAMKLGLNFDELVKIMEVDALNNDLAIAMNLNSNPQLVEHFQHSFQQLVELGTLTNIKEKWQIDENKP